MYDLLIGFFIYFFIVGIIAFASTVRAKKNKRTDYTHALIGNRSINYVLTALSAQASDMSDWLFMAFPAAIYTGGMQNGWIAIGLICGMWATWHFIASPIRRATEEYNCYTLSSYFEKRFQDRSGILRLLSALMALLFFAVYIAAGLKGFGFLAESIFKIPYAVGTALALLFTIFYIGIGGYTALAWIDCFQALFLLIVIFFVPLYASLTIDFNDIATIAIARDISLSIVPDSFVQLLNALLLALSWGVCYFGMPHIVTKFMGIARVEEMKKAQYVGMSWQIAVLFAAGAVGIIGLAYFQIPLQNPELVFVEMVKTLFPRILIGFILSAVAGATLSVITAQLLVIVSVLTEDFYRKLRPKSTDREMIFVYRATVIFVSVLAYAVSLYKSSTIQALVSYAWMGLGCSFGPLLLLALYSTRINKYGAAASILTGGTVAAVWFLTCQQPIALMTGITVPAVIPGFLLSIASAYGVSAATK